MWCSQCCYGWLCGHKDQSSLFGCHITVSDVASGGVNEGGDGLVGCCCGYSYHGTVCQSR